MPLLRRAAGTLLPKGEGLQIICPTVDRG
jgi:hypothetical protein